MDLSFKPTTSNFDASTNSDISNYNINNMDKDKDCRIILTTSSNALPSGLTVESVFCLVDKKERQLGRVYLNGNGVYTEFVCTRLVSYKPGDSVYVESSCRRDPFETFNICTIQEFFRNKRDGCLYVRVKGFYRLTDIPESEYQRYIVQDRTSANNSAGAEVLSAQIQSRELVASDCCDAYPVSALRGLSEIRHFRDIHSAKDFVTKPDSFFYIFGYNSKSGLAPPQGEIRVGAKHQATLPKCIRELPAEVMKERNPEDCVWRPKSVHYVLLEEYLMAARSVYAYRSICLTNYQENEIQAIDKDEAVQKALDSLHKNDYNLEEALHALMKAPQQEQRKWNEDDTKTFVKGLRKYEKNFFRIRKELLPQRTTAELIEFYYLWKKTQSGSKMMKSMRKQTRRPTTNLVRRMRGRPSRTLSADYVDLNPSSEEDRESEDSDKDLTSYQCTNCSATESKDWHPTTKDKTAVLCSDCRLFYKKYGELRPTEDRENSGINGKSASEEETNENINTANGATTAAAKNGPTTRRTNNSGGRPKSGNTSPDTVISDKNMRSPGSASVSSGGSGDQKQPKKRRGKNSIPKDSITEVPAEAAPLPARKRRKTSASDSPSECSPKRCDPAQPEDSAIPGDTEQLEQQTDSAFATAPIPPIPTVTTPPNLPAPPVLPAPEPAPAPSVPIPAPPASIPVPLNQIPAQPVPPPALPALPSQIPAAAVPLSLVVPPPPPIPAKVPIKLENLTDLQVKSPGMIRSPKTEGMVRSPKVEAPLTPGTPVKTESIPVGVVLPMPAVLSQQFPPAVNLRAEKVPVKTEKSERSQKERSREKENIKHEPDNVEVVDIEREANSPGDTTPGPDPKPDHAEILTLKNNGAKMVRVWNRGELNSCARTDLIFSPPHGSKLANNREQLTKPPSAPSTSASSSSKSTIKSPVPLKDGKRTPAASQSTPGERDRDNRSGAAMGSLVPSGSGPRIADTPPRISLPSRHMGLSPHGPEAMMHPVMGPFGPMSPNMYHEQQQQMQRMREMEAHRLMRAGSIPPGYMPGMPPGASNLETAQMMDHIRRMQGNPMMNMYPGLSTQHALSMMNEQHQREALMERALAAGMMQAGHNPAGLSHMHGLHPELAGSAQDQAALFHMMHGGGNPFVRAPFMGSHNPGPNAEMLQQLGQQMGRATAMDQEAAYFHAAQAAQAQHVQAQMHMRQMEEREAAAARMHLLMNSSSHPDFMRMGGG